MIDKEVKVCCYDYVKSTMLGKQNMKYVTIF